MIVEVTPRRLDVRPGVSQQLDVVVTNTSDVIGGYVLRVLGADPGWVDTAEAQLSLFPDESRTVPVTITVPAGLPAGERRIAIQVRELTPPAESAIDDVVLVVPEAPALQLRADPAAVQGGRRGRFSVLVDNTGNTTAHGVFAVADAERAVKATFNPPVLNLAPGEHTVVDLVVRGKQPFLGQPLVRVLNLYLDDADAPMATAPASQPASDPAPPTNADSAAHRLTIRRRTAPMATPERTTPPLANATFVQRPVVGRGSVSLVGLLAAVTVFAIVLTVALSRIVGQSEADRNLALQIASAQDAAATTSGTSSVAGTVRYLTSGRGVASITVDLYSASNTTAPVATTATSASGAYRIGELAAGDYKITFRGAGFTQLWYPQAIDPGDAATVTLAPNTSRRNLDVALGGLPATLSGTVHGDNVAGATLTLRTTGPGGTEAPPPESPAAGSTGTGSTGTGSTSTTGDSLAGPGTPYQPAGDTADATNAATAAEPATTPAGAVVETVPIAADGSFSLANVPSPSVYELDVSKPGYATSSQLIDVDAGEARTGLNLTLRQGDGTISGTVTAAGTGLSDATLTATSGQTVISTASLDGGSDPAKAGTFTLRGLPTPARFTLVVSKPGYVSQTLGVSLAAGQSLTDLAIALNSSSGGLTGQVSIAGGGAAGGVSVTVTDGTNTVQTSTESSGAVGTWSVGGLAVPGTYTVTFSRADLASHTLSVSLDATGAIAADSQGNGVTASSIVVAMHSATASLSGVIKQSVGGKKTPVGEAEVTLTSGTSTYTVTTASLPASARGSYRFDGLPPGTYSVSVTRAGVKPVSTDLTLGEGSVTTYGPVLQQAASLAGHVYLAPCQAGASCTPVPAGWIVQLYKASDYPATVYQTTHTTAGGAFSFVGLDAPESYIVEARPDAGTPAEGSTPLTLEGSQHLTNVVVVVSP